MNVAVFCHTSKLGGAEIAAVQIARGVDAELWLAGEGDLNNVARANSVRLRELNLPEISRPHGPTDYGRLLLAFVLGTFKCWRVLRKVRPAQVICNSVQGLPIVGVACRLASTPCHVWVRDLGVDGNRSHLEVAVLKFLMQLLPSRAIFNSQLTRGSWNLRLPSVVIGSGIADEFFQTRWAGADSNRVLMVGRIAPWKGQRQFLDACNEVRASGVDIRPVLAGAPLFGEGEFLDSLRREYDFDYLGAIRDVASLMSGAACMVHASQTPEPFGQVLAQAGAIGVPIVCSDQGGHLEWLIDGASCLTVKANEPESIARAITQCVKDREGAQLRATRARAGAEAFKSHTTNYLLCEWLESQT